jgi:DNA replication protein DnaC
MSNFPESRNDELALLAQEAKAARARAARKAQNYIAGAKTPQKEEVSPDEYLSRLRRSQKRDTVIVKEVREARIKDSLKDWKLKVGPTFGKATTDNPKILERVARIKDEQGRHKTSLILSGSIGAGKTWLSYAYINLAISSGAVTSGQVIADTESAVLSRIASSGYKRPGLLEELCNPRYKIYFVDDVGQGYFSNEPGRTEVWYELIDHIYSHQLTLIITTNLELNERSLGKWIGVRAFDRMKSLVGNDGVLEPGKVNRREGVLERHEEEYRSSKQ